MHLGSSPSGLTSPANAESGQNDGFFQFLAKHLAIWLVFLVDTSLGFCAHVQFFHVLANVCSLRVKRAAEDENQVYPEYIIWYRRVYTIE